MKQHKFAEVDSSGIGHIQVLQNFVDTPQDTFLGQELLSKSLDQRLFTINQVSFNNDDCYLIKH